MCEWNACGQLFSSSEAISIHIIKEHLTDEARYEDNTFLCRWPGCNKTRRAKWSLVTHITDHHCQEHQLRQACGKRVEMGGDSLYLAAIQQQFEDRINEPETVPSYTQAAAMDAIRRHSAVHYQREFTDEQEGPVTKCIRLTTALILRNIARYSEEGRCKLRRFELQLCPLALSRLEASGALIQCLAEMDNTKSNEPIPSFYQPPLPQTQNQPQSEPVFVTPFPPSQQEN
jgi:AT-rich interactive domain-containing protein 2